MKGIRAADRVQVFWEGNKDVAEKGIPNLFNNLMLRNDIWTNTIISHHKLVRKVQVCECYKDREAM